MADVRHRNIVEAEKHEPKNFSTATNYSQLIKDENSTSRYLKLQLLEPALDFVDGFVAPPVTPIIGDTYLLLDEGSGTIDAGWDSCVYNDLARFNGVEWVAITPTNGNIIYNLTTKVYHEFKDGVWSVFIPEVPTLYSENGTILTGREATITDTLTFLSGRIGIGQTPNSSAILDLSVNNKGFLPPIVTNAEMNAISSPADYLLVFNSEEKGWFYYSPTLTDWIPLSKGYGIISVNDSSGVPTFYADLQTALETCKTGVNTVTLHSNIVLTTQINMNDGGTGVGNGYLFDSLTINLNGYKLSMATADSQNIIDADLFGLDTKLNIINGIIERTNATSGTAIYLNKVTFSSSMLLVTSNQTAFQTGTSLPSEINLGFSRFISSGSATTMILASSTIDNFYVENTGSGVGVTCSANLNNFTVVSNSGIALDWSSGNLDNFNCYSNTSNALKIGGSGTQTASNFTLESNTNNAILRTGFGAKFIKLTNFTIKNGGFRNQGSFSRFEAINFTIVSNNSNEPLNGSVDGLNFYNGSIITENSTGSIGSVRVGNIFKHVNFIALNTKCIDLIDFSNVNNSIFEHCSFTSEWDNAGGHSVDISGIDGGTADFKLCTFNVANAGANHIYSSDAEEIKVSNCVMNDVATTSINANVTITATTDLSNGNRQL